MILVVIGVSGAGKTTIGSALAQRLGWRFLDADDFHPPENIAKMAAGIALDDEDRWPWLERLNEMLKKENNLVLACSALKDSYRQRLTAGVEHALVYLHGDFELIAARLAARRHRYMPPSLLQSQFAALEPPRQAIAIDVSQPVERSVAAIIDRFGAARAGGRAGRS